MMYRDSLAVSLCARCAQYLLLVRSTTQLCMKYSKKWVLNTQPVLVAIEMIFVDQFSCFHQIQEGEYHAWLQLLEHEVCQRV
jgi:hypothetical protein